MKLKFAILLLVCLLVGVGCTDSNTLPKTSPSATPGIGKAPAPPPIPDVK